jgi:hypothetical protein
MGLVVVWPKGLFIPLRVVGLQAKEGNTDAE